ncbi:MAG: SAM-dependent DNA methyltransferase, partial [Kineosporiaceae bacterium]|nr:SAM-dependent DNA methyltransferase [Aeromicrobium sp.]
MLDLVRAELETGPQFVDKTFFEPSAGDGNFLIAILRRKLHAIERRY